MKILYTSDLHGDRGLYDGLIRLTNAVDPDLILLGGDLMPKHAAGVSLLERQMEFALTEFPRILSELARNGSEVAYIWGNDDCVGAIRRAVTDGVAWDCTNRIVTLPSGITIAGCSFVPPTPFRLKDWERRDEAIHRPLANDPEMGIASVHGVLEPISVAHWFQSHSSIVEALDELNPVGRIDAFLAHSPPFDTSLDVLHDRSHVGSKSIREFISRYAPSVSFHGHIHETYAMTGRFQESLGASTLFCSGQVHHPELDAVVVDLEPGSSSISATHTHLPHQPTPKGVRFLEPPFK